MLLRFDLNQFGIISSAFIIYNIVFIIMEWGFAIYSIKILNSLSLVEIENRISAIHWSKLIFFIFSALIIYFLFKINIILSNNYYLFLSLILLIFVSVFNPLWVLQFLNKTELLLFPTLFSKLLQFVFIFYFLENNLSFLAILLQALSFCVVSLCGYFYIIKKFNIFKKINIKYIFEVIKSSKDIFFNNLNQNFSHTIWGAYLVIFGSNITISIFNLADTIFRAGNSLTTIFVEVLIGVSKKKINLSKTYFLICILILIAFMFFIVTKYFFKDNVSLVSSENVVFYYITICSWLFVSIIKILGYPILSLLQSVEFINKTSNLIVVLHAVSVLFFMIFIYEINLYYIATIYLLITLLHLAIFCLGLKFKKINF